MPLRDMNDGQIRAWINARITQRHDGLWVADRFPNTYPTRDECFRAAYARVREDQHTYGGVEPK